MDKSNVASDGVKRRALLRSMLSEAGRPLSGSELAQKLGVSRQVIVQDIALLRAEQADIVATYRGYQLSERSAKAEPIRVFHVQHGTDETLAELQAVVDCGGRVQDVFIDHALYGEIRAALSVANRLDAEAFVEQMARSTDEPLKSLTGGSHYHTVSAPSAYHLDCIASALRKLGFLLED